MALQASAQDTTSPSFRSLAQVAFHHYRNLHAASLSQTHARKRNEDAHVYPPECLHVRGVCFDDEYRYYLH